MSDPGFDPYFALGVIFGDAALARCVRETAKMSPKNVDALKCYQAGIRSLDGIEQLPNLMRLDLHMNEVQDGRPLSSLRRLEDLHLGINFCSDVSWIAGMTSLKSVTLFGNEIEDVSPLSGLVGLEVLHLRFNIIDDASPLAGLVQLKELSLSDNLLDDLSPLSRLTKLEVLNFYKNYVTDLSPLAGMRRLRQVYFGRNPIRDITPLLSLPELIEVSIDGTEVSNAQRNALDKHISQNRTRMGLR